MKILVINCGSSSLKYQLIDMNDESVVAKGLCERIGIEGSVLTHQPTGKDKYVTEQPMPDHKVAIGLVLEALQDPEHGVVKSTDEISAVGHRVLHAGTKYCESIVVDDDVKKIAAVVRICCKTLRIVKQNIVFALAVKALVLLLGAFGLANMWEAVFADVGVSVIAILNSMRALKSR